MGEIISVKKFHAAVENLKKQNKKIVLAGGCFDVLHPGHVVFLEKAKKAGDILVVLLESDEKVKKLKGQSRPFHNQSMRAQVLSALKAVDYVILLPFIENEEKYDKLVIDLKPAVIAATKGAPDRRHKERTARLSGARLEYVTEIIGSHSTSRILNH